MRAFYEQCLWITEIFLAKNPDLHHGLLAQFSNSPGALLVHYNCESVCFSRILAAQVLRNQSRFPLAFAPAVEKTASQFRV
jgi:hypothetical protein